MSFFRRLFGSEPPPPPRDARDWNEDWRIGDTAECVVEFDDWHSDVKPWNRPPKGKRMAVIGFSDGFGLGNTIAYYLKFAEYPGVALATSGFRKVRPAATENREIVERILKAKPGADNPREPA